MAAMELSNSRGAINTDEPNCVLSFFLSVCRFFRRNKIDPNEELRKELHLLYTASILAYKAEYSDNGGLECHRNNVVMS
ncbi:hypothetical protein NC652_009136 [Populus alba x Populus x berolinensis]|nr:hypothetical protein NC652_009136 [Populus alba x Populus x berolinensis]